MARDVHSRAVQLLAPFQSEEDRLAYGNPSVQTMVRVLATGNVWLFTPGVGWELQNLPPGDPAQLLTIPDVGDPRGFEFVDRDSAAGFLATVDFADGATHALIDTTIEGGRLGPNGYVAFGASGFLSNSTGATRTVDVVFTPEGSGMTCRSPNIASPSSMHYVLIEGIFRNLNDQAVQPGLVVDMSIIPNYGVAPSVGPLFSRLLSSKTIDTALDWTFLLEIDADGVLTSAEINNAWMEVVYLP